jgi:hypothetical protein
MSTATQKIWLQTITKVLGLTLFTGGIWMACSALALAFSPPSYAELLTRIELPANIKTTLEAMQPQGATLVRQVAATFVLQGLLPMVLGFFLVRTGGGFKPVFGTDAPLTPRSALRRFFIPRMSFALARIEDDIERGYQPFTLGK